MKQVIIIISMMIGFACTTRAQELRYSIKPVERCITFNMASLRVVDIIGDSILIERKLYSTEHSQSIAQQNVIHIDVYKKMVTGEDGEKQRLQKIGIEAIERKK